jgi:hypothetical protein
MTDCVSGVSGGCCVCCKKPDVYHNFGHWPLAGTTGRFGVCLNCAQVVLTFSGPHGALTKPVTAEVLLHLARTQRRTYDEILRDRRCAITSLTRITASGFELELASLPAPVARPTPPPPPHVNTGAHPPAPEKRLASRGRAITLAGGLVRLPAAVIGTLLQVMFNWLGLTAEFPARTTAAQTTAHRRAAR